MFLIALVAIPGRGWTADNETKGRAARTACLAGDYAKGVALLAELYVSTLNEVHIFNQGRCFEQNGKYEEAIIRFREYKRKSLDAGRTPHPRADEHIADCQKWLDKHSSTTPSTNVPAGERQAVAVAHPPPLPLPVASAPEPAAPPDLHHRTESSPQESGTHGRPFYSTWWFWTTVGATVIAGSLTAFLLTRQSPDGCDGLGMRCVGVTGL